MRVRCHEGTPAVSPRISTAELKAIARGTPLPRPETDVVGAILKYLALVRGVCAWRMNSRVITMPGKGGRPRPVRFGGVKGMPDIQGIWSRECPFTIRTACWLCNATGFVATPFYIEAKRPDEKRVRQAQEAFLTRVTAAGAIAFVARGIEDVAKVIR